MIWNAYALRCRLHVHEAILSVNVNGEGNSSLEHLAPTRRSLARSGTIEKLPEVHSESSTWK
jgi:hypothetical protein